MLSIGILILGFIMLMMSARWFVDGAIVLGKRYRLSDLFIGVAIVAVGTSLPELAVNVTAAARGYTELATANILGSNIANILIVIGVAALMRPVSVNPMRVRVDLPLTILATLIVVVLGHNFFTSATSAALGRIDGLILIALFAAFIVFTFRAGRPPKINTEDIGPSAVRAGAAIALGAIGLAVSANVIVNAAITLAVHFGVSQALVGETIIALGTSLPELAASIAVVKRGTTDILIGNIIGSNIFNLLVVLGVSSLIVTIPFNGRATANAVIVGCATAALWAMLILQKRPTGVIHPHLTIRRSHGIILVASYVAYLAFAAWQG